MRKTLLFILSLFFCCSLQAQTLAESLATGIDTIKGKPVYVYQVRKGEGLYRIAINFGVTQEAIIKLNPILQKKGLQLDQIIYVPIAKQPTQPTQPIATTPVPVKQAPEAVHQAPLANKLALRIDTIKGQPVYVYQVRKGEGIYRIAINFGVTQEAITQLNPILKKRGLQTDQIIYVPIAEQPDENSQPIVEPEPVVESEPVVEPVIDPTPEPIVEPTPIAEAEVEVEVEVEVETEDTTLLDSTFVQENENVIKIAYLLPFLTHETKRTPTLDRFVEFYEGALLALKDGQTRSHQSYEIFVFDTGKDVARIQQVLQDSALQTVHAIVGPAYPSQVPYVSDFAKAHQIPTIIPFTSKVADIEHNPFILQFNPSEDSMVDSLFHHLQTQFTNAQYIYIQTDAPKKETSTARLIKHLKKHNLPLKQVSDSLIIHDSLALFTQANRPNILLFDTDKYNKIEALLPHLTAPVEHPLYLISYYGWMEHTLPIENYCSAIFKTANAFDFNITRYNMLFHIYYGHAIDNQYPRYDMLGYDITSWLMQALQQDTLDFQNVDYHGIQSDIHFHSTTQGGGLENTRINIIQRTPSATN